MSNDSENWATCALTQLGFIRLSTNPLVGKQEFSPGDVVALLGALTAHDHHYLADHPSSAALDTQMVCNPLSVTKQVTNAYRLAFARHHQATLLTLDEYGLLRAVAPD